MTAERQAGARWWGWGDSTGRGYASGIGIPEGIFGMQVISPHPEFGVGRKWGGKGMGSGLAFQLHHWLAV